MGSRYENLQRRQKRTLSNDYTTGVSMRYVFRTERHEPPDRKGTKCLSHERKRPTPTQVIKIYRKLVICKGMGSKILPDTKGNKLI